MVLIWTILTIDPSEVVQLNSCTRRKAPRLKEFRSQRFQVVRLFEHTIDINWKGIKTPSVDETESNFTKDLHAW